MGSAKNPEEKKEAALTKEIAVKEMQEFVQKWDDNLKPTWEIEKDYPQVIQALEAGLLVFDEEKKPTYTLRTPILTEGGTGEFDIRQITFRTRIQPLQLRDIMKGLDIGKNQLEYPLRCLAYITHKSMDEINKFQKFDYKVIDQLSTVFL